MVETSDEACGLPSWRVLSWQRKIALVFCFLLVAINVAGDTVRAQLRPPFRIADEAVFLALIIMVVWAIRGADEFIRRVHLVAATIGFIAVALGVTLLDLLQQTGTFHPTLSTVEIFVYIPWACAMVYFMWRYR